MTKVEGSFTNSAIPLPKVETSMRTKPSRALLKTKRDYAIPYEL